MVRRGQPGAVAPDRARQRGDDVGMSVRVPFECEAPSLATATAAFSSRGPSECQNEHAVVGGYVARE